MSAGQGRGRQCLQPARLQAPMLLPDAEDFGVNLLPQLNATGHSGNWVECRNCPAATVQSLQAAGAAISSFAMLWSTLAVSTLSKTGRWRVDPTLR